MNSSEKKNPQQKKVQPAVEQPYMHIVRRSCSIKSHNCIREDVDSCMQMFDRLLNATRSIFTFRSRGPSESINTQPIGESSRIPLRSDAATSMVTTRSQSQQPESSDETRKTTDRKRKRIDEDKVSHSSPPKKRSLGRVDVNVATAQNERTKLHFEGKDSQLPLRQHRSRDQSTSIDEGQQPADAFELNDPFPEKDTEDECITRTPHEQLEGGSGPSSNGAPANHVRFASDEPPPVGAADSKPSEPANTQMQDPNGPHLDDAVAVDDVSDDDEAPETITVTQGQSMIRASAAGVAKAIKSQESSKKESRRKRDAQFKQQAKTNSTHQAKNRSDQYPADEPHGSTGKPIAYSLEIPELLPPEILNAEPEMLQEGATASIRHERHFKNRANIDPKPPPDVIKEGRIVRILDRPQPHQLPEVPSTTKNLREGWLAGKRGKDDLIASRRKSLHSTFKRR